MNPAFRATFQTEHPGAAPCITFHTEFQLSSLRESRIICRFADGLEDFQLALEQYEEAEEDDDDDIENEDVPRYKIYHRLSCQHLRLIHCSLNPFGIRSPGHMQS